MLERPAISDIAVSAPEQLSAEAIAQEFPELLRRIKAMVHKYRIEDRSGQFSKDIAQETTIKALEARESFRQGSGVKTWLYRIAENAIIDYLRRQKHRSNVDDPEFVLAGTLDKKTTDRSDLLLRQEIITAISALKPALREVVSLLAAGNSYKEIAEKLDIPLGTVMSRLFHGRNKLAERLGRRHIDLADLGIMREPEQTQINRKNLETSQTT